MSVRRLWLDLFARGVTVTASDERLVVDAPKGVVDQALRARLKAAKPELLEWLAEPVMSSAQARMWLLQQMMPHSGAYNVPLVFRMRGPLDVEAVSSTLRELAERHEVLRTRYPVRDGRPTPVVESSSSIRVEPQPQPDEEAALKAAVDLAAAPFDLARAPPLRAALHRIDDQDHLLALCTHHIACDGWSAQILLGDFVQCYEHALGRGPAPPPPGVATYRDYARYERTRLDEGLLDESLTYWLNELRGLEPFELCSDRRRPAEASYRGDELATALTASCSERVRAAARSARVTPFVFLLACHVALLWRFRQSGDVVIGTAVSNRETRGTERLVGSFANNIVLSLPIGTETSFSQLLARTHDQAILGYEHQAVPFERVVDALDVPRDRGRNPVFQHLFMMQNAPAAGVTLRDVRVETVALRRGGARLDLSVQAHEAADGRLHFRYEWASDLFDRSRIESMAQAFIRIVEEVTRNSDIAIADVDVLGREQRRALTVGWARGPRVDYPQSLHAWLERAAATHGGCPSVMTTERTLTYEELWRRAGALAHRLANVSREREDVMAICLPRDVGYAVAVVACFRAGIPFVPVDPAYPDARIAFVVEDCGVRAVLCDDSTRPRLGQLAPQIELIAVNVAGGVPEPVAVEVPRPSPAHLAYVIYTSGSTGKPKGVLVEHRGIANLAQAQIEAFDLHPGDRVLQFAGLGFDAVISELFTTFLAGATLCLPGADEMSGTALADRLEGWAINVVTLPPSTAAVLPERAYEALRTLVCAGEASPPELVARWAPGRRFINAYGPTEGTVCATMIRCEEARHTTPIGRVIDNVTAYVLDERLEPVPIGVWGELAIGGVGVARGYVGRPALTAERFVPDPYAGVVGARMYRTGDIARWTDDGVLEFRGRVDDQVKVRGHRIELGEVEASLRGLPGVDDAAAVVAGEGGASRLVGYVVGDGLTAAPVGWRETLAARVPAFVVPSALHVVETLPQTAHGKVDRRALSTMSTVSKRATSRAPSDDLERELLMLWRQTLDTEELGVHDSFFEVGGQSLLAARVVAAIGQRHAVELSLRDFMVRPTVAAVAERIRAEAGRRANGPLVALAPASSGPEVVFVAPVGGELVVYGWLVEQLAADASIHGLREVFDGPRSRTLEELIAGYREALAGHAWRSTVTLVGWSVGGLIAHALATTLPADAVSDVVLLDAWFGDAEPPSTTAIMGQLGRFATALGLPHHPGEHVVDRLRAAGVLAPTIPSGADGLAALRARAGLRATFSPAAGGPPLTLIHADVHDVGDRREAVKRWSAATPRLGHHVVAADHEGVLRASGTVDVLRRQLRHMGAGHSNVP